MSDENDTAPRGRGASGRRAVIADVARVAGVSVGTVSNYLNRPYKVALETQAAIERAIAVLDFVPNGQARSLASGASRTVGMVVTDLSNSFFVDIARGAEESAIDAGHTVLLASSVNREARQRELLGVFDEARVAGLLLAPFESATVYREPEGLRGPTVVLNVLRPIHYGCSVVSDDELGGYLAARHMIEQGRRWVHFIGGPERLAPIAQRLHGVRRAIAETSGEVVLSIEHVPFADHLAEGAAIGRRLRELDAIARPDAIVSTSDLVALALVHAVQGALHVPDDLAVIGYDNNAAARDAAIPVSTVAQAGMEMGAAAFALLLDELQRSADHEHRTVTLDPHLVIRASSSP